MNRYLSSYIKRDTESKIVLLSGPRQAGKTTLARSLFQHFDYFSFDRSEDREHLFQKQWHREKEAILFDELHKMPQWKSWLKGIYDTEGNRPRLLVTGSANLSTFTKVGDSLAGRYFSYRLHPIDLEEGVALSPLSAEETFKRLMSCGGFPEPFLNGTIPFYRRWQKSHLDIILRQDFLDLYSVRSIKLVEILLLDLLRDRVGSSVSVANLARYLQVDPKSVQTWLSMLENIYAIFRLTPYHQNISRSLVKEPKFYFYDIGRVTNESARLENLVACALLKRLQFLEDTEGLKTGLHYLRTKDGKEIDFLITLDNKPFLCMEIKTSDDTPSSNFKYFRNLLGPISCVQLVLNLKREFDTPEGVQVRNLVSYLSSLSAVLKEPSPESSL